MGAHAPLSDPINCFFTQGTRAMSKKSKSTRPPIRVSLRFGMHSDNTLVRELRTIPPYGRAKFVQRLIKEAWHSRRCLLADPTVDKTLATDT